LEKMMTGYMLDTNVFNDVVAGRIGVDFIARYTVFATHVQRDELEHTQNDDKRANLLSVFHAIDPGMKPTSTAVWDDSVLDNCQFSAEDGVYEKMLVRLEELDRASRKKSRELMNTSRDVRIAETAIKNDLTVVTTDMNLAKVTREFGGSVLSLEEFRECSSGRP
jgi:predicted nucleic acid-binding protein